MGRKSRPLKVLNKSSCCNRHDMFDTVLSLSTTDINILGHQSVFDLVHSPMERA